MKHIFIFITAFILTVAQSKAIDYSERLMSEVLSGDLEKADSTLLEWSKEFPNDPSLYSAKSLMLLERASSLPIIGGQFVIISEENADDYMNQKQEWNDSLFNEAIKTIDEGITKYPDNLDLRLFKIDAYTHKGDADSLARLSISLIEDNKTKNGSWKWGNEIIGDTGIIREYTRDYIVGLIEGKYYQQAIQIAKKLYEVDPNDYEALRLAGVSYMFENDPDNALKYLQTALKIAPNDQDIISCIEYVYMMNNETQKAIEFYKSMANDKSLDEETRNMANEKVDMLSSN